MALHKSANCIFFPGLLAIVVLSLPLISTENIDCKGKAFHCVNSTHFKICVDLGGGVSRTVDEFLIPCPKSTVCSDINKFECEYQVTTTLPSIKKSDVTNVLVELGTASPWDNVDVTTFVPENDSNNSSATTIDTSYLLTINDTSNFININQVDSNSANNVKYNKTNNVSDEYRVTTALPSIQQRDVTSVLAKLGTTLAWDVDVTTLAPENNTNDSSATTIGISYSIITNDTSNFIPSTTLDDTLKQVNSSSVNNVEYNKTSDVSDSATVTNIDDVSAVNTQITLNDIILNSTLNKSVLLKSGELYLPKTNQGETEINIDVLYNTSLYVNNNEKEYANDVGNLPSPLSRFIVKPILYSTETTSFLSDYNDSTTLVSVPNNLNISNVVNDASTNLLRPTITTDTTLYSVDTEHPINLKREQIMTTSISYKPLTTVASESFTNMKLNVSGKKDDTVHVISQIYSSTENTSSKASTSNVVNGWNGFTRNIDEQNKFNKTETPFTLVSSNTELPSTKYLESITLPYTYDGLTTPTETDWQNSENIVTSSIYTTDLYSISKFQNHSADMHVLPTRDDHLVTPVANILTEVLHNVPITTNESLTQYILESNTPADVEISNVTEANLKAYIFKVINNDSNVFTDISPTSDLIDMSFTKLPEINVSNNTMYNVVSVGLTSDDKLPVNFNNTNARNISSGDFNNNDTTFVVKNTSTITTLIADLYNTTLKVTDTAFTFQTNAPLANTNTLNINFTSMKTTHPDSNHEYYHPHVKIINMEKPSSSDLNLDINNRIIPDYPNTTATIETFDKDSRDYISSNLSLSQMHDNISVSLLDTTTINPNQDIEVHVNERLNNFYFINKNSTSENITKAEKTDVLISSPNTTYYGQLNLRSSELTTSKDTTSVHPLALQLNSSSVNKTNLGGPDVTNDNDVLNTINEQVQSSLDQNVTGNNLNITQEKEEYKTFNLPLSDANFTLNNNLINTDKVIETTLPIQKQKPIQLETHENKTDDVNTKSSKLISTTEFVTIADSSNLFITSYKEPRETYDSITPHILDTTNSYISKKEDLTTNNSYNVTNFGGPDVTNNNDILNTVNEQVQSSLDQIAAGNNLNITQEKKEYKTFNLPLSDANFTLNNNLINTDKVIETTLPIQKQKPIQLETHENKTDDVNTKASKLISTTEVVTIAESSNLFITSYKEPRETYDSITPHILETTNIYPKEDSTTNNLYVNDTNLGVPNVTNNNDILNTIHEQVQSGLDQNVAGNNLNITQEKEEYKTVNLPVSDANFTSNNNLININIVIETTLPIQKENLVELETHENKTNDVITKASELISTNEAVTIADSSNLFLTGYEEPRETYDSVTPHILDLNNSYNVTNFGGPDVRNNNDILNTVNKQVQSSLDQIAAGNNLNITQEKKEYKTFNLPLSDANFTVNNNMINTDKVIETTLPIQKKNLIQLETHENKTDDVNIKTNELISTTEAVTIADSSNLFITSYKEPRETYDSVTPHILDTTNPYIYPKEDLTIAEPPRNTNDQQNSTDSIFFANIENVESGVLSTPHNTWKNISNIQDLNVSNYEAVVISDAIVRSSPFGMKINSLQFNNSFSVNTTLNLSSIPINIAQTKPRVVMLDKNYSDNSSSTTSNVYKDHKNGAITTKVNVEVNEEKIIGMLNNDTLTHNIDKIKSELTGADVSSSSKNLSILETEPDSNFELSQNSKKLYNDSTLQYNENKNNVNILALLGKSNNSTRLLKQNEDSNQHTATTSNIIRTTSIAKSVIKTLTVKLTNEDPRVGNQTPPSEQFTCDDRDRGKYSDKSNCNKFYICIRKRRPIIGMCPENTVFSEIRKQCTNNLSHCIRNNQFRCLSSGRFIDVLSEQFYYICVKKLDGYVRFKLKCQKGYHLNKEKIQCSVDTLIENSSNSTSDKSTNEMKSEDTSHSANYKIRFECEDEGKFEHPDDCRKYFVCRKNSKSKFRRKIKKCSSDEVFNKDKRKCVDADSYEC